MGKTNNLNLYPIKENPQPEDYILGTCATTGKTMNFRLSSLLNDFGGIGGELKLKTYSFQFDDLDLESDINNISDITDAFLDTNGTFQDNDLMFDGRNITFNNTSRFGFVFKNVVEEPFRVFDSFNQDITDVTFDKNYDSENKILYLVSKEYVNPSTIYFKLVR